MIRKGPKAYSKAPNKAKPPKSLLMLDLNTDKLYDSGKEDEGKTFHVLQVLGMNKDLWDRVLDQE